MITNEFEFVIPPFLGWEKHFANLPINRENVLEQVTQLKASKIKDHNDETGRLEHMSNYIATAIMKSVLKSQPRPHIPDQLILVDEPLIDYLFENPSLFAQFPTQISCQFLQSLLVTESAAVIFKNKERYIQVLDMEVDKKLFQYFVDLVEADLGSQAQESDFPFGCTCPEVESYKYVETDNPVPKFCPLTSTPSLKKNRILSIDGGGIRGLVPLQVLKELQSSLDNGATIQSCFDLVVGTSTGALIALTLAAGHSVQEIEALYFQMKDQIFCSDTKPYDGLNYEKLLQDFFGANKKMKDITGIKVVVTATYGTIQELRMKLFTNFDDTADQEIWKVARRTSAAPSYFDPMTETGSFTEQEFYDGGLVANNPTRAILMRFTNLVRDGVIVSLGTGKPIPENILLPKVRENTLAMLGMWWYGDLEKFGNAFINRITSTDGDVVEDDMRLCKEFNCNYFRLTPTLNDVIELDETDEGKIVNMMWASKAFVHRNLATVDLMAKFIVPSQTGWSCPIQ